ncbi:MAG: hypothetical protein AAF628_37290, partial [Planctomycetota bacterium]
APSPATVALGGAPARRNWRLQAVPARLALRDGAATAELRPVRPSGDPFELATATGYALLPADTDPQELGACEYRGYGAD